MKKKYMLTVGRRVPKTGLKEANDFLHTVIDIRNMNKENKFIPKGVYKFKTFKEANLWQMRLILGISPDHQ